MSTLDRYSSTIALAIVIGTFAAATLMSAFGRAPDVVATAMPALIYVLSTREPTVQPTPDTALREEIAELRARVAELEAEQGAPAVYQEMTVQVSAPVATPYTADPQSEYSAAGSTVQISVPTDAPRLCDGFGDLRDYDQHYASSPACHS